MQIKDQIRARREALDMDMAQLAMRVGVTEQTVRHWESGRSYPSKSKIRALEQALSFTMDWSEGLNPVSGGTTAASMIDQGDVDLLLIIAQLPGRAKTLFAELARMHLDVVQQARRHAPAPVEDPLAAARAAVAQAVADKTVTKAKATAAAGRKR